ncbi:NlpC/P60 family protein [Mucilaginibacter sp.]|uniref:C40 family peptidase n=1 Tax=Mucilaginibacter sp. TaxID=1882438 RepID=UPI0025D0487A|nr:NlpC/P60 family protein [Mucilaginibacter sp.]
MRYLALLFIVAVALSGCHGCGKEALVIGSASGLRRDTLSPPPPDSAGFVTRVVTGSTTPAQLIAFAQSLQGIPYLYASTDPARGFDCSGYITYVFNHFNIAVPRRSVDFTYVNRQIPIAQAKTGDLVLFTGLDSALRVPGHMGILKVSAGKTLTFLHSTSGKAQGVTETPFNSYYNGRYLKTIRVFRQNDQ